MAEAHWRSEIIYYYGRMGLQEGMQEEILPTKTKHNRATVSTFEGNTDFGYSKFLPTNMALGPFVAPRVPFDAALQDLSIEASNTQNFQKMTLFRALQ
jgi:hypothetical protein